MEYLIRSVELSRWTEVPEGFADDELPADSALARKSSELATIGNTLSFWLFEGPPEGWMHDAALAIAGGRRLIEGLHLTWIERSAVEAAGLTVEASEGNNFLEDLRRRHVDIVRLDMGRLARLVRTLCLAVRAEERQRVFTKETLARLAADAVMARRVNQANLPSAWQEAVRPYLERQ